jgi:hypothetical protein
MLEQKPTTSSKLEEALNPSATQWLWMSTPSLSKNAPILRSLLQLSQDWTPGSRLAKEEEELRQLELQERRSKKMQHRGTSQSSSKRVWVWAGRRNCEVDN